MNYVTSRLEGGLGNLLFQISAGYALSLRDCKEYVCMRGHTNGVIHGHINSYFNNIFRKLNFLENTIQFAVFQETHHHYQKIPKFEHSVHLQGYFQSEKYFKDFESDIRSLFCIDENTKEYLLKKYSDVLNLNTCSLHVRRGDYLVYSYNHPQQSSDFYKKAIELFSDDTNYIIFSDDINWCKNTFSFLRNKIFAENNTNYQDLYLMSLCKNNIMANSSFSWWGSWLNNNKDKKVIIPKQWFGPNLRHHNCDDIPCEGWISI